MVTEGPGSRVAGIARASQLIDAAQERWRAVTHLVALVRAGAPIRMRHSSNATPCSRQPKPATTPLFSRPPPRINPSTTLRDDRHPQVLTMLLGWCDPASPAEHAPPPLC
jgi:hypothetical protein